jgi:branched-subunit amino acid transport protein
MDLRIWFVILAAGIITYLIRLSFIIALERLKLPDWFLRGLRYVPPAVLSAIIVPELANWNGQAVNLCFFVLRIWM